MDANGFKPTVLSILCVDDDTDTLSILKSILTLKYPSVQMHSADNGEAGLALFKQHRPNIVITDISLPKMDGIQLASEVRRLDMMTQIIIMSGHPENQYLASLSDIGINKFIQKPISFHDIFIAIDDSLLAYNSHSQYNMASHSTHHG